MTAFSFLLARTLGLRLPEVLALSWGEFRCWAARYAEEPWGEWRADLRSAIVASTVANMMRGSRSRVAKVSDFMPFSRKEPQGEDEIRAILLGANGGEHGG